MRQNVMLSSVVLSLATVALTASAQEFPTPGPEHEILRDWVGTWDADVVDAGGEQSKAVAVYEMAAGDLWLVSKFEGSFGGAKFEGRGFDGYDPIKKKYVAVWVDSMSPSPLLMEGTHDAATKTTTMFGEGPGPDGNVVKYKMETTTKDKDTKVFKIYVPGEGGDHQLMLTITYHRRK